ncbi:TIGR03086 family metal-binding protein [Arthrobacter sp. MYb213]|uniref:TIGR03086 family metal-binding protein n=1 Tax=Arthrobacter sp. MYb213 TaxID=1848595 RepID=UPI000CFDB8A3|nr:TIGR03086 family metal-binding protein [Arthrobacter sp. MYb213]PRB67140.1 TIGR03086 family protein [Arthrobacter sp. MYb213]
MRTEPSTTIEQLSDAFVAVQALLDELAPEKFSLPTPCTEWDVRELVAHLVGMNLVFAALLTGQTPPSRDVEVLGHDPSLAFRTSADALLKSFERPAVLEQSFHTPLGSATGQERLEIRMYDLLAHAWDLSQATGVQLANLDELAEHSLDYVQAQLSRQSRTGRFAQPQPVSKQSRALDRLAAFLGRKVCVE